ncbi:hypothetical protein MIS46_08510 [Wielerella bovis]|uniref:hypothetical protein n=1 Tax=Wielerella bovis TaxID=2917790 RepID=UPI002018A1EA|nr:hypothetical protein [Wielerella bovis]ULJ62020.1 hypothetical protein MIS46_08510 [Wielerella bovis]
MKFPQFFRWQIQLILLLIFCFCAYFATGYGFHYRDTLTDKFWGIFGTFCLLLAWASVSSRGASVAFKIFLFTTMIYFPVAWLYGAPSFKLMGGALEADTAEVGKFVHFVPKYVWPVAGCLHGFRLVFMAHFATECVGANAILGNEMACGVGWFRFVGVVVADMGK